MYPVCTLGMVLRRPLPREKATLQGFFLSEKLISFVAKLQWRLVVAIVIKFNYDKIYLFEYINPLHNDVV